MTRIAAGDYLLPDNDGETVWRLRRYVDGPSLGLDIPRDRDFWGVWRWTGPPRQWNLAEANWTLAADLIDTRAAAIEEALTMGAKK